MSRQQNSHCSIRAILCRKMPCCLYAACDYFAERASLSEYLASCIITWRACRRRMKAAFSTCAMATCRAKPQQAGHTASQSSPLFAIYEDGRQRCQHCDSGHASAAAGLKRRLRAQLAERSRLDDTMMHAVPPPGRSRRLPFGPPPRSADLPPYALPHFAL